jgi:hypothetical protein
MRPELTRAPQVWAPTTPSGPGRGRAGRRPGRGGCGGRTRRPRPRTAGWRPAAAARRPRRGCARPAARPASRAGRPPAGSPCRAARGATWRRSGPAPAGWAPPPSGPSQGTCRRGRWSAGRWCPWRKRAGRRRAATSARPACRPRTGGARPAAGPPRRMSTGPRARRGGNPLRIDRQHPPLEQYRPTTHPRWVGSGAPGLEEGTTVPGECMGPENTVERRVGLGVPELEP